VKGRLPAEGTTVGATSTGVETDMIPTEKTSPVVIHINKMVGKRGQLVEFYKSTIGGVMNLTVFLVTDTRNLAQWCS
jgi:hypothetical protein